MRFFLILVLVMFIGTSARALDFQLNPSTDAFVTSATPTSNYGGAGALEISAAGLAKGEFQSVVQFDFSTAKAAFDANFGVSNWFVSAISLQMTAANPNNAIFNTSAAGNFSASWMQNDGWTEGTGTPMTPGGTGITYNTLPSFLSGSDQALGTYAFNGATTGNFNYGFALTSGLVGDITAGSAGSIRFFAADTTVSALFNSGSFTTTTQRPLLTITALVPEPSVCGVFGAAMILMMRRKSR